MSKKSAPLRIIPLGGLDGIGKNMTAFECGDDMVLIDAGLMFPDDDQPGVDLVLPDYSYVLENEDKLRGIIKTTGAKSSDVTAEETVDDLCAKCDPYAENWTPTAEKLLACSHGCAQCSEQQAAGK